MTFYIVSPKESTQKSLELINDFSKITECNTNIQKLDVFLYTTNEQS